MSLRTRHPQRRVLGLGKDLRKAESALLVQARTGRIGLAKLLHSQRVPGFDTAKCQCYAGHETPRHVAHFCVEEANRRQQLRDSTDRTQPYARLIGTNEEARRFVRWMMFSNRLGQFVLAKRLLCVLRATAESSIMCTVCLTALYLRGKALYLYTNGAIPCLSMRIHAYAPNELLCFHSLMQRSFQLIHAGFRH